MTYRVDTNELPWRESPYTGVSWKKLYYNEATDESAVLLRFQAGAAYGRHLHPAGEQYLILEGNLKDGDDVWSAGSYVRHPPGSVHRPESPDGCLVLVTLPKQIVDLENAVGTGTG